MQNAPQKISPEQVQQLLQKLSDNDRRRVESILQNEQATKQLLSTPQAQQLLQKFGGRK